jgi:hypothetical protein
MPPQQGVGRGDRRDVEQGAAADPVRSSGQPSPVVISQPKSTAAELSTQESVLFDEVGQRLSFPAFQPTSQHQQHHLERRGVDHEAQLISQAGR